MKDYNWKCTHCKKETETGFMVLRREEEDKVYEAMRKERKSRVPSEISWEELSSYPYAYWTIQCLDCSAHIPDDGYVFSLDRIQTHAEVLEWTFHMSGRGYSGDYTNWESIIRSSSIEKIS